MKQYELFYRDTFLGLLTVDPDGRHHYRPDPEGVEAVRDHVFLEHELRIGTQGFVSPIPFFQNRLMNMKRWNLREINYQTDYFLLREKEPPLPEQQ